MSASSFRRGLNEFFLLFLGAVVFLLVAWTNDIPFIFSDSMGYIDAARRFSPDPVRSSLYYLPYALLGFGKSLWPWVYLQAILTAVSVRLVQRVVLPEGQSLVFLFSCIALSLFTPLSLNVGFLLADYSLPLLLMLGFVLLYCRERMQLRDKVLGSLLFCLFFSFHLSHLPIVLLVLLIQSILERFWLETPNYWRRGLPLILLLVVSTSAVMSVHNKIKLGNPAISHRTWLFLFARFHEDHLLDDYFEQTCPKKHPMICVQQNKFPDRSITSTLWRLDSYFNPYYLQAPRVNRELKSIVLSAFADKPFSFVLASIKRTFEQMFIVTKEHHLEVQPWLGRHLETRFSHEAREAYFASWQYQHPERVSYLIWFYIIVAGLSLLALSILFMSSRLRSRFQTEAYNPLCCFILGSFLANAIVMGALSVPTSRYQLRFIPVLLWAVVLTLEPYFSSQWKRSY